MIRYLDVCSGYSAFTLANAGLGYRCVGYSEIEAFPRAILEQRHGAVAVDWDHLHSPGSNVTPLFGDFTKIEAHHVGPVDLLAGGTPCQAFSVAGKRLGLDDPRGNLTLEFLALARRVRAPWLVWENVPGFLSHDRGRTMGTFLGLLGELGYGWAYRVLDAQYIRVDGHERAVPQRRRRVFVVAHLGDAAGPAAVLFERESLRGDSAPRRGQGEGVAPNISARTKGGGGLGTDFDCDGGLIPFDTPQITSAANYNSPRDGDPCHPLAAGAHPPAIAYGGNNSSGRIDVATAISAHGGPHGRLDFASETFIAHSLRAEGFDASEDGTGRGTPPVPVSQPFVMMERGRADGRSLEYRQDGTANAILTPNGGRGGFGVGSIATDWVVRRLTPTECERLMGVPDGFTAITYRNKPAADGPRCKALGNSQAVNVMRWIARGLADVIEAQRQPDREAA